MSTNFENTNKAKNRALIKYLCEIGLYNYTLMICEAHSKQDWARINDVSLQFEKDCYNIGEVKIAGKLILLRVQLQMNPIDSYYIESTLRKIFELAYNLQLYLIEYLESLSVKLDENKLHYIKKMDDLYIEEYNRWPYNSCSLQ